MVGMPVTTLRIVGDDDMRPMVSQDGDQLGPNRVGRHFGEMLIPIAEYLDVSNAEDRRRRSRSSGLSHSREFLDRAERWIAARARLTSRRGDQRDFSSGICIPARQTGCDEAFVVRMREHQQDASRHEERMLLRRGQLGASGTATDCCPYRFLPASPSAPSRGLHGRAAKNGSTQTME